MGQFVIENNVQHTGWVEGYEPKQEAEQAPAVYSSLEDAMDVLGRYFGVLHERNGDIPNASEYRVRDLETGDLIELKDSEHSEDNEQGHFVTEIMDTDGDWDSIMLPDPEDGVLVRPMFTNMTDALIAVMMDIDHKNGGDMPEDHEVLKKIVNETRYRIRNLDTGKAMEVKM